MDVTSIICEYNLFHNGHLEQIGKIRAAFPETAVLALMSGNFVQRGEPAILPKTERAAAAVSCGADLVLELPFPYAMGSAEYFARGGVGVLDALGCVTRINFGSESGSLAELSLAAGRLSSPAFTAALEESRKQNRSEPISFIKQREAVYEKMYGEPLFDRPNDILAVEYLRAVDSSNSGVTPTTIKRVSEYSATKTREAFIAGDAEALTALVPRRAFEIFAGREPYLLKNAERAVLSFFRLTLPAALAGFADVTDGLENRLRRAADDAGSLEEFFALLATKKYTDAKLRRVVLNCMLSVTEERLKAPPLYANLLAANGRGCELLRVIKKSSSIPIITKPAHYKRLPSKAREQYEAAIRSEAFYALLGSKPVPAGGVLKTNPVML